ncbi:ankyrin repeat domain-containing protein 6-like isoform 3-T4 [Salvelinus alpinus]
MDEASHSSERLASRAGLNRAGLPHHHHHRLHYSKTSVTPTSPYHRRRRHKLFKEQALAEDTPRRRMNGHPDLHRKSRLCTYDEAPPHNGKTYQLYTLYRDKDGNVKQAPANGCHCKPLIKRLEGELNATKEEMRTQMLTVQEQVYTRLGRMDRKSIHQIKVLDMLTQERVAAERMECLYRMDQRAAQSREEAQRRQQAAATQELKRWCMTQIQDMDLHLPADPQYYKLLPSPSVGDDGDSRVPPPALCLLRGQQQLSGYLRQPAAMTLTLNHPQCTTQSGDGAGPGPGVGQEVL